MMRLITLTTLLVLSLISPALAEDTSCPNENGNACYNQPAPPVATLVEKKTAYGNISYPQISGMADKWIEQKVNQALNEEALTWTCEDGASDDQAQYESFNASTTLRLIDDRHLSFTVEMSFYCGGNHPNNYMAAYNFDLKHGISVPLNKLLPSLQSESLTTFLLTNHKFTQSCFDENGVNDIASVYDDAEYISDLWVYYRTKDQIVFFARLPQVVQACSEEFPISLDRIKPFLAKEYEHPISKALRKQSTK